MTYRNSLYNDDSEDIFPRGGNRSQDFRELNRRPSEFSGWFSGNESAIKKSSLVAIIAAGALAFGASLKQTPIELKGAEYTGVRFEKGDGNQYVYFNDQGVKLAFVNKDSKFDAMKEQTGRKYDLKGYLNFWGKCAKSITPTN